MRNTFFPNGFVLIVVVLAGLGSSARGDNDYLCCCNDGVGTCISMDDGCNNPEQPPCESATCYETLAACTAIQNGCGQFCDVPITNADIPTDAPGTDEGPNQDGASPVHPPNESSPPPIITDPTRIVSGLLVVLSLILPFAGVARRIA